jgi:hypothetical protein
MYFDLEAANHVLAIQLEAGRGLERYAAANKAERRPAGDAVSSVRL